MISLSIVCQRLLKSHQGQMINQITVKSQYTKRKRSINQQQGNTHFQTQAVKFSQASHLKEHAENTSTKIFCISALRANASASAHNASSMVHLQLNLRQAQRPRREDNQEVTPYRQGLALIYNRQDIEQHLELANPQELSLKEHPHSELAELTVEASDSTGL